MTEPLTFGLAPHGWQGLLAPHGRILTVPLQQHGPVAEPIVLTDAEDIIWADAHRDWYPNLIAPSADVLRALTIPSCFYSWMVEHGFRHLVPALSNRGWPRIIKEDRLTCSGWGVFVARNAGDYFRIQSDLLKRQVPWIEEEAISWPVEHVAHHLVVSGEIRHTVVMRIRLPDPLHIKHGAMNGEVVSTAFPELAEVYRKLNYTGFACVNFKQFCGQTVKIFEINPRIGASLLINEPLLTAALRTVRLFF